MREIILNIDSFPKIHVILGILGGFLSHFRYFLSILGVRRHQNARLKGLILSQNLYAFIFDEWYTKYQPSLWVKVRR